TDGQWILDMEVFRSGLRPAISTGLSVTRVGSRGHNPRQKAQNQAVMQALTAYAQALEFSHFGTELSSSAQVDLIRGEKLRQLLSQIPGETYGPLAQQLMLEAALDDTIISRLEPGLVKRV